METPKRYTAVPQISTIFLRKIRQFKPSAKVSGFRRKPASLNFRRKFAGSMLRFAAVINGEEEIRWQVAFMQVGRNHTGPCRKHR